MHWIWIDRIIELTKSERCVAIKNVSLAEDVLHDHFPTNPVMPHSLVIEGMAQTAGILVCHARDFAEKVILAKISSAQFTAVATPGRTIRYTAILERIDDHGAATSGKVELIDPATSAVTLMGEIDLMFSHIDQNRAGVSFPEENFVLTEQFRYLLKEGGFGDSL